MFNIVPRRISAQSSHVENGRRVSSVVHESERCVGDFAKSIRRPSDARSSSSSLVAESLLRKTVRLARIHARVAFFCFRDNPKRPKGTGPSHQAAARGFHSATRRSSARRAKRAYTGPSGKGDLLSSFRCGDAWKRRGDLSFRFLLFFSARPGKTQARVVRGGTARRSLL